MCTFARACAHVHVDMWTHACACGTCAQHISTLSLSGCMLKGGGGERGGGGGGEGEAAVVDDDVDVDER